MYVLSNTENADPLFDQRVAQPGVPPWRHDGLFPITKIAGRRLAILALRQRLHDVDVLRERNMNERHVQMDVGVFLMLIFQRMRCGLEPIDLVVFDPVVALLALVAVGIEEVDGERRVPAAAGGENFDVVVPDAGDGAGAGLAERVGEGLEERHLRLAREGGFLEVIVVPENRRKGDLMLDEYICELEDRLVTG